MAPNNTSRNDAVTAVMETNALALSDSNKMTALREHLEFLFTEENLKNDSFLFRNLTSEGYAKINIISKFRKVKALHGEPKAIVQAALLSKLLELNADQTMIKGKVPLSDSLMLPGQVNRTVVVYNFDDDASEDSLKELFTKCGEVIKVEIIVDGEQEAKLREMGIKPPTDCIGFYATVELSDAKSANQAVLSLSKGSIDKNGLQVLLHNGKTADELRASVQRLAPSTHQASYSKPMLRRAQSSAAVLTRSHSHVDAVGEGMDDLKEGKIACGVIFSVCGSGGLITPDLYPNSCISFRLIHSGADDSNVVVKGDKVSFKIGQNKKTARKYASRVRIRANDSASLQMESSSPVDGEVDNTSRPLANNKFINDWLARRRAMASQSSTHSVRLQRQESMNNSGMNSIPENSFAGNVSNYQQAKGPDGSRGFKSTSLSMATAENRAKLLRSSSSLSSMAEEAGYSLPLRSPAHEAAPAS